jgi:hypothetical protein
MAEVRFILTGPPVRERFQEQPKEFGETAFGYLFVEYYLFDRERCLGVRVELIKRVTGIKVPEGIDREKMPVGRIDKGPARSKIRHNDLKYRAWPRDPVEFLNQKMAAIYYHVSVQSIAASDCLPSR